MPEGNDLPKNPKINNKFSITNFLTHFPINLNRINLNKKYCFLKDLDK